jgi:hypothetical protein
MSESVDNGGESYSGSSRKYNQSSSARSSESPSSESHAYSQPQASSGRTPIEKDKVEEIKKLLRETEAFLIQYAKTNFPLLKNEEIKADFRKTYNSLPANEQQQDKNKLLMNGLNEFVEQKRQENSKLKYW